MLSSSTAINFMRLVIPGLVILLVPAGASAEPKSLPFLSVMTGNADPMPTDNPCILTNSEAGTGFAISLGAINWASEEVIDFCADVEPGSGAVSGQFVLTGAHGDKVFGVLQTVATFNNEAAEVTFAGTYEITGGSGRFENATGKGTIAGEGSLNPPFEVFAAMAGRITLAHFGS